MRKTKTCAAMKVQEILGVLVMRKCWRPRHHDGKCMDDRGAWSTDD